MSAPSCPCITVGRAAAGIGDDGSAELPQQLRHGDGDQLEGARVAIEGALEGSGDGEEDMGEQGDGGPGVPGGPGGDLPGVQARDLPQRLLSECLSSQTGMMTAAAPASPHVRPSVTSVLGTRDAPPYASAATCRKSVKVTIYNCRNCIAGSASLVTAAPAPARASASAASCDSVTRALPIWLSSQCSCCAACASS